MDNTTTLGEIPTKRLEEVAAEALRDARCYKTCKDGSYEACLASYNYKAVMAELHRRIKC